MSVKTTMTVEWAFHCEENVRLNKANKKTKRFVFERTTDTNDLLSNLLMTLLAHWFRCCSELV